MLPNHHILSLSCPLLLLLSITPNIKVLHLASKSKKIIKDYWSHDRKTQELTEDFTDQRWYNWRMSVHLSSLQSLSCVQLFATPRTAARQASLSITNSQSLHKLTSIESVMPSNHLNLCRPLLLLPSVFPSIRVFSNESVLHIKWPKYWSFSFGIIPSNEYSGIISFRTDWFDLAVQGTLRSLLQHHSSKASILQSSAFFMVQLSHPYMNTGKTIALQLWLYGPLLAK